MNEISHILRIGLLFYPLHTLILLDNLEAHVHHKRYVFSYLDLQPASFVRTLQLRQHYVMFQMVLYLFGASSCYHLFGILTWIVLLVQGSFLR